MLTKKKTFLSEIAGKNSATETTRFGESLVSQKMDTFQNSTLLKQYHVIIFSLSLLCCTILKAFIVILLVKCTVSYSNSCKSIKHIYKDNNLIKFNGIFFHDKKMKFSSESKANKTSNMFLHTRNM